MGRRPDEKVLQAVLSEAWSLLQQPDLDPIVKRATFVLAAAAARGSESIRKELVSQVSTAGEVGSLQGGLLKIYYGYSISKCHAMLLLEAWNPVG